jgi:hypothetical protein
MPRTLQLMESEGLMNIAVGILTDAIHFTSLASH